MNIKQLLRVIKIYKKQINDLQLEKSSFINRLNSYEVLLKDIESQKKSEMDVIAQNINPTMEYAGFFKLLKIRSAEINEKINLVKQEISQVNDKIVDVFKEQRKYEILIDKFKLQELEKEKREELKLFDELNIFKRSPKDTLN
ncbi:flagellar FliJ family protein [Holosporaceae bacterium 'Namur']|nr:flagellar FliJ family protein [Holosporaceae bacterium 'Namur']